MRNIVGGSPGGRKDKSERMMTFSKLAKEEKGGGRDGLRRLPVTPARQKESEILSPFISLPLVVQVIPDSMTFVTFDSSHIIRNDLCGR